MLVFRRRLLVLLRCVSLFPVVDAILANMTLVQSLLASGVTTWVKQSLAASRRCALKTTPLNTPSIKSPPPVSSPPSP